MASVAIALDIAQPGEGPFDLALETTVKVETTRDGYVPLFVKAWADPTTGKQTLDAELCGENGSILDRLHDIAPASPFAPGTEGRVLLPVSATVRSVRFRVKGRGPSVGSWTVKPYLGHGYVYLVVEPDYFKNGFELADEGKAFAISFQGRAVGRLEVPEGWRLASFDNHPGGSLNDQIRELLVLGPSGERGVLEVDIPVWGRDAIEPVRFNLDLRGVASREFTLTFHPEGEGAWFLPFNQGLRVPSGKVAGLDPGFDLDARAGHFLSMPAFGWDAGDSTFLMLSTTPADEAMRLRPEQGRLTWVFRPSQGVWGEHHFSLDVIASGARSWAAAYRELLELGAYQDEFDVTKLRTQRPRLIADLHRPGAVNIHYWKKVAWWNNEPRPEALAAEMKAAGLDRVLWSQTVAPEAVTPMAGLGWLLGSYENFQDLFPTDSPVNWGSKEGWPEQAVLRKGGDWVRGWPAKQDGKTYYAGVRSSAAAEGFVHAALDARKQHGQSAVFLDTTTASGPVEDWNPLHPMTRTEDLRYKRAQLAYGKGLGLIVGSESGHDGALGAADYFEGMQSPWPGRFEDSGYVLGEIRPPSPGMLQWGLNPRTRAPLFDLAYHDRYVGYEYWGDAANRMPEQWRRRDLFSVLYAQPQLWVMDEERWRTQTAQALKSYRTWSPIVRHCFGQRMTDWRWVDKVGDVQETAWEDGSVIRVDFVKDRIELSGPVKNAYK